MNRRRQKEKRPRLIKKRAASSPYARIDWVKASVLFEKDIAQRERRKHVSRKDILRVLAAAADKGILLFFRHDPASVEAFLGLREYPDWQVFQAIKQLRKQKYVTIKEHKDGSITVKITKQGRVRVLTYQLDTMRLAKPEQWDGRWRVVIFDIPERDKRIRDIFRMRLRQLGLYLLQESVFVSPYPCFDEVEFLRELYGVAFTVRYLLVEKIEDDASLRQHFQLVH